MITTFLNQLLNRLKGTASLYRKKLIAIAVLAIAFVVAKKKLKTHHIVNTVMFFFKISSKLVELLPAPIFTSYRNVLPFNYQPQEPMPELITAMNIAEILQKIKVDMDKCRKI